MKLLFLGVSYAFAVGNNNFQSNMLLECNSGKKMLIDCGSDVRHSLHALGYSFRDIDAVYISHLHADHIGGMEWLGFCKLFSDNPTPELYISEDQREALWKNSLSGGMSCLENESASLSNYFAVQPIKNNQFVWENHSFSMVKTLHSINNHNVIPSYGLFIKGDKKSVFITTDARFKSELFQEFYQKADIIFQDCETFNIHSNQHAHYAELKELSPEIKQKMWLYDYQKENLPDAKKDGFIGFVKQGQSFSF